MDEIWKAAWATVGPYVLEAVIGIISAAGAVVTGWLRNRAQRLAASEAVRDVEASSEERTDVRTRLAASRMRETMGPLVKPLTLNGAEKLARELRKELENSRP